MKYSLLCCVPLVLVQGKPNIVQHSAIKMHNYNLSPWSVQGWISSEIPQVPLTLEFKSVPLKQVLDSISQQSGFTLKAGKEIAEYRISALDKKTNLRTFMLFLPTVLGHGTGNKSPYFWERTGPKDQTTYTLRQTRKSILAEIEELDAVRSKSILFLRDFVAFSKLSEDQRSAFESDFPDIQQLQRGNPDFQASSGSMVLALAGLDEGHLQQLIDTGATSFDAPGALQNGFPGVKDQLAIQKYDPPQIILGFEDEGDDSYRLGFTYAGDKMQNYPFMASLDPMNVRLHRDTYDQLEMLKKSETGPTIDLFEHLPPNSGNPILSLPAALDLWSKETGRAVYAEIFVKEKSTLLVPKGTPEYVLAYIAFQFHCDWGKVGNNYVLWSKTCPIDRFGNIPESTLTKYSKTLANDGLLSFANLMEISAFNDRQLNTFMIVFGNFVFQGRNVSSLRFVSQLSGAERAHALTPEGVLFSSATQEQYNLMRKAFGTSNVSEPVLINIIDVGTCYRVEYQDAEGKKAQSQLMKRAVGKRPV